MKKSIYPGHRQKPDNPSCNTSNEKQSHVTRNIHQVYIKKYFALIYPESPVARINNRAVKLARKGKFKEAEILFHSVLKETSTEGAVYNNLGIIYELFKKRKKAFAMYSKACIINESNSYFKKNFFKYNDSGQYKK